MQRRDSRMAVEDFVIGNNSNVMGPGDLLTRIDLPTSALRERTCFRPVSFTHLGPSTALLIGTLDRHDEIFVPSVSAATEPPDRLK